MACETASSRSKSCRSSGTILSACRVDAVVGVSVGRVREVLAVDAAFAECAGISKFPSIRAGLMGAHLVKLLGAQPTHKWSVRSTISAAYVHIFVNIGCIVMRSNLSVMKRFTVARHFSGHAV